MQDEWLKNQRESEPPQVSQLTYTSGDSKTGRKLGELVIFQVLVLTVLIIKWEVSIFSFRNLQQLQLFYPRH